MSSDQLLLEVGWPVCVLERESLLTGWLVDSRVMKVLQEGLQSTQLSSLRCVAQALPGTPSHMHVLSLWNTGLAGQSIVLLVQLAEQQKLR